jgi:predicted adenine nucleotide alpha hydrolase (AANH) superfamily ATPase
MTITELIKKLNAGLSQYGNIEITYFNPDISKKDFYPIRTIGYNQFTKQMNIISRLYPIQGIDL